MSKIITAVDLSTPEDGSALRARIERSVIAEGEAVVTTLATLSPTTAALEACFGVLAERHGADWVASRVRLPDITTDQITAIAEAIQNRIRRG